MTPEDSALLSAFLINFGIGGGIFLVFCYLRNSDRFVSTYSPMCAGPKSAEFVEGFYSWITACFKYKQNWLLENRGLDAVMYIRFQQTCLILFSCLSILAFVTVVPANVSGTNKNLDSSDRNYVAGLAQISMANIEKGSHLLWVHCLFLCFSTFFFMYLQRRDHKKYSRLRLKLKKDRIADNYTVQVVNYRVPGQYRTLSQKTKWLTDYFNQLFEDSVLCVRLVWNEPDLDALKQEEEDLQLELERKQAIALRTGVVSSGFGGWLARLLSPKKRQSDQKDGEKIEVDSIPYLKRELAQIRQKIASKQNNVEPDLDPVLFVTFRSLTQAILCAQSNLSSLPNCFETSAAVDPKSIVWHNYQLNANQKIIRSTIVYSISFFLTFFYMIPITFIQTLANLRELADTLNWTFLSDFLDRNPGFESFFSGYITPLVLVLFIAYLLPIMRALSDKQGFTSMGELERSTLNKFFFFLVFQVFLATTIAGSVLNKLQSVVSDPGSIVSLFASSLPQQGSFFITYVMLNSSQMFFKLLNGQRLVILWLKQKYLDASEREYRESEKPEEFDYVSEFSNDLLIMQICFTYSVMFPIILPFAALYFLLNLFVSRYRIVYMCDKEYEMKGCLWPDVFIFMSVGVIITNTTMLGVLGLYQFTGSVVCLILLGATFVFTYYILSLYGLICEYGALDEVNTDKELDDGQNGEEMKALPLNPKQLMTEDFLRQSPDYIKFWSAYVQPALVPPGPKPLPQLRLNRRGAILDPNYSDYVLLPNES